MGLITKNRLLKTVTPCFTIHQRICIQGVGCHSYEPSTMVDTHKSSEHFGHDEYAAKFTTWPIISGFAIYVVMRLRQSRIVVNSVACMYCGQYLRFRRGAAQRTEMAIIIGPDYGADCERSWQSLLPCLHCSRLCRVVGIQIYLVVPVVLCSIKSKC